MYARHYACELITRTVFKRARTCSRSSFFLPEHVLSDRVVVVELWKLREILVPIASFENHRQARAWLIINMHFWNSARWFVDKSVLLYLTCPKFDSGKATSKWLLLSSLYYTLGVSINFVWWIWFWELLLILAGIVEVIARFISFPRYGKHL